MCHADADKNLILNQYYVDMSNRWYKWFQKKEKKKTKKESAATAVEKAVMENAMCG